MDYFFYTKPEPEVCDDPDCGICPEPEESPEQKHIAQEQARKATMRHRFHVYQGEAHTGVCKLCGDSATASQHKRPLPKEETQEPESKSPLDEVAAKMTQLIREQRPPSIGELRSMANGFRADVERRMRERQ